MKYAKAIGVALLALLVVSGVVASTAAAGGFLPAPTELAVEISGSGGFIEAIGGGKLSCKTVVSKNGASSFTSEKNGTADLELSGCEFAGMKCKTAGDMAGVILTEVNMIIGSIEESGKLFLGLLMTPKVTILITCGGVLKLEVKEGVIAEVCKYRETAGEALKAVPTPAAGTAELILALQVQLLFKQEKGKPKFTTNRFLVEFGKGFEEGALLLEANMTFPSKVHIDY